METTPESIEPNSSAAPISGCAVHKQLLISDIFGGQDLPQAERFDTKEEARSFQTKTSTELREDYDGNRKYFVRKNLDGTPITNKCDGWAYLVPVLGRTRSGNRYSGPSIGDILKTSSGPIRNFDIDTAIDRFFDGREPQTTCCLNSEWPWEKIERVVKRSVSYEVEGRSIRTLEGPIIEIVHTLEVCLKRECQDLTTEDIANFWESWEVERCLSEFCGKILADDPRAQRLAGISPPHKISEALNWVRRKIYAYSNNVREQIPFPAQAIESVTKQETTTNGSQAPAEAPLDGEAPALPVVMAIRGATNDAERAKQPDIKQPFTNPQRCKTDFETSRERIECVKALASELATIKQDLDGFCTVDGLKTKHPEFVLWRHLSDVELKELVDGTAFTPKAYAQNLTLRKFGITSRETLKKDRKKLRSVQISGK